MCQSYLLILQLMDQLQNTKKMRIIASLVVHLETINDYIVVLMLVCAHIIVDCLNYKRNMTWNAYDRCLVRAVNFDRIVFLSDRACVENTRMDRRSFHSLCHLLKIVGQLEPSKNMGVEEMVAIFLHILSHDIKNRVIKRQFMRNGETISRRFNYVLYAVLRCHKELFKQPQPIQENCTDGRWKWFKVNFESFNKRT